MKHLVLAICGVAMIGCSGEKAKAPEKSAAPEYFKVDPATAGNIKGIVGFVGKRPAVKPISMDSEAGCEQLHNKPVDGSGFAVGKDGGLANVFVYIKSGLEGKAFEPPKEAVILDQRGCMFVPRVIPLQAQQTLTVRNSDPVSHNIHPNPQNNREWNQQQSPGAPDLVRRFARPEVMIPVKCNVHSWMRSYIGVLDHPYLAVTSENGEFAWTAVPPGSYTIGAWHETFGELTENIKVSTGADSAVKFTFRSAQ
jgi:hypothetical protein